MASCRHAPLPGETLAATELRKQFPRAYIVVYNERLLFGQLH
jgi:hypothetical protein